MNLTKTIALIVKNEELHAKWLNTLSLMENSGARKISACQHPTNVNEIILKHAAEEARHAYFLKKQIAKLSQGNCPTYEFGYLLAPVHSYQYLNRLDIIVSRYIKKQFQLRGHKLQFASYLFVTYAIEIRADKLYPIYQDILSESGSKVNVKSIIAEEEGHLAEMQKQLVDFSPEWELHAQKIVDFEDNLFTEWMINIGIHLHTLPEVNQN